MKLALTLIILFNIYTCLSQDVTRSIDDIFSEFPIDALKANYIKAIGTRKVNIYKKCSVDDSVLMFTCGYDSLGNRESTEFYRNGLLHKTNQYAESEIRQSSYVTGRIDTIIKVGTINYQRIKVSTSRKHTDSVIKKDTRFQISKPSNSEAIVTKFICDSLAYDSLTYFYLSNNIDLKMIKSNGRLKVNSQYVEWKEEILFYYDQDERVSKIEFYDILYYRSSSPQKMTVEYDESGLINRIVSNNCIYLYYYNKKI